MKRSYYILLFILFYSQFTSAQKASDLPGPLFDANGPDRSRTIIDFDKNWKFYLGDTAIAKEPGFNDGQWRTLNLPHDYSIEGDFSENNPGTTHEGALPAGIGWYRKTFTLPEDVKNKNISVEFDGVYRYSEVWINGHYLGKRPNGYISFYYDLTPYCNYGAAKNVIAVKVDNSAQPNSRWYSGSGIYRNVRLVLTNKIAIDHWGTFITTPEVNKKEAKVNIQVVVNNNNNNNANKAGFGIAFTDIYDASDKLVYADKPSAENTIRLSNGKMNINYTVRVAGPKLWSVDRPYLYKAVTRIVVDGETVDKYTTLFGIRYFAFDIQKGFSLNGQPTKISGVCMHHDLGALGAAVNVAALQRQLQLLKDMGCNAIRTSHNPPAPELLDLCDKMGFIVMDEAFDMWRKKKTKYDYSLDFEQWHERDLQDQVKRDRNHPCVFIWSIGNEIREQFDSTGITIAKELAGIVKQLDSTRPITSALTETDTAKNYIYRSGALDLVGLNYHQKVYAGFLQRYPGKKFIGSETMSALETRGHYDMPSDSIRRWPLKGQTFVTDGNPDYTVSAYDNVSAYWGSTHEETWKIIKQYDFLSGLFIWTGFDYLGEPTPYPWPARSSYFGIIDLAGFPKDVYYMYKSEWTDEPVLHLFPHWNWPTGKVVDVWAYYNNADEVELFLNNKSLGVQKKQPGDLHVEWRVVYEPGTLKAVSRKKGKTVLTKTINTAGAPVRLELAADKKILHADGKDMAFVTVKILDANGNIVPDAGNKLSFEINGEGIIAGSDNGYQADLESFKGPSHKAYNGLCLIMVQATEKAGSIHLTVKAPGLSPGSIQMQSK